MRTVRGSLARDSLRLGVLPLPTADARLGWLSARLGELPGSGIVYALTVSAAEDTAALLREAGHEVRAYTGRTDPADRLELERALRDNEVKALVATSALGMGFDKPDLGFVVHLGAPASPVAYYQQVGRAGRATERADVLLLPASEDREIWRYFATASMPRRADADAVLTALAESSPKPMSTAALETVADVRRTRLELLLKVLDVEGAVHARQRWLGLHRRRVDLRRGALRAGRGRPRRRGRVDARLPAHRRLPDAVPAGGARRPRRGRLRPLRPVRRRLVRRRRCPTGRCRRPPAPCARWGCRWSRGRSGRAACRGSASPSPAASVRTSGSRRVAWSRGSPTSAGGSGCARCWPPVPRTLPPTTGCSRPASRCSAGWGWAERPVAVAAVPSLGRPQLVASVAGHLAALGRLADLGTLDLTTDEPSGGPGGNSAFRLAAVHDRFAVPAATAARLPGLTGPVLLVDDLVDSRWTMTVAGALLRRAGAPAVLPFALAAAG